MGQPPGPFDPPPRKSGPSAGLWVALGLLVVALIGGVGFVVVSGDDDEDGGSENTSQSEATTTTAPGSEAPTDAPTDEPSTEPSEEVSGEALEMASTWIYDNTPEGVDEIESECMAGVVIKVVGEGPVSDASGDLTLVYENTETSQDEELSSELPGCLDSDSLTAMQEESGWPWFEAA